MLDVRYTEADRRGRVGEQLAVIALLELVGYGDNRPRQLFEPHRLGEKSIAVDLFVDVLSSGGVCGLFAVQVKTTTADVQANGRLPISLKRVDVERHRPVVPTFVFGVHLPSGEIYVAQFPASSDATVGTMPTSRRWSDPDTPLRLYECVRRFWDGVARPENFEGFSYGD